MLKKITGLISRIYDLIIKLISVKGLMFAAMLYLAIKTQDTTSITYAFFAGVVFVGGREYAKFLKLKYPEGV